MDAERQQPEAEAKEDMEAIVSTNAKAIADLKAEVNMQSQRWKSLKKNGKATAKWTSLGLLELNRQRRNHILI